MKHVLVVGAGISGLASAYFLKKELQVQITIIEKELRVGGILGSTKQDGYVVDWAANGFLSNENTLELVKNLKLENELQRASEVAKHRYIYSQGHLRKVLTSPIAFLGNSLLTPNEKLRLFGELFARNYKEEETVFDFIQRHFGKGFADTFAGVFVLGIAAGDAKELSLDALFPSLRKMEKEHGSLIKALIQKQRQAKKEGKPRAHLMGFKGGMQTLIDALYEELEHQIKSGVSAYTLTPLEQGYSLALSSGEVLEADAVILATPAFVSAELLRPLFSTESISFLNSIPYADVQVFGLGFNRADIPKALDGFGFLVPRSEDIRTLGVLYGSTIFPEQAPKDSVLLRIIMGGTVDPTFANLPPDEALKVVRDELRITMGIVADPQYTLHLPWPKGIPQYQLGHCQKVNALMQELEAKNILLTGNAYNGIGVNDCISDAKRIVQVLKQKGW